jgi:hypothetical protein
MALNFNEKDFAFAARIRCMLSSREFGDKEVHFYDLPEVQNRFGFETLDQAQTLLANGDLDAVYVIAESPVAGTGGREVHCNFHRLAREDVAAAAGGGRVK